jgi:2-amino-4-hydroxy-6-hydroxymethyldihydropteridine diphosphokinase
VRIDKVSSIYETAPFGLTEQAYFLNMAARVETRLPPRELLQLCLGVENAMGRIRTTHWGPRIIDIDLLVYDSVKMHDDALTLPHPGIEKRAFVLLPLLDIARKLQLADGRTVEEIIADSAEIIEQEVHPWKSVRWDSPNGCFV